MKKYFLFLLALSLIAVIVTGRPVIAADVIAISGEKKISKSPKGYSYDPATNTYTSLDSTEPSDQGAGKKVGRPAQDLTQFSDRVNLHLIDSNSSGFEIYRSGNPYQRDIKGWCKLGIEEVMVLAGDAKHYEIKYQDVCPRLKIIYNIKQAAHRPLTVEFLNYFEDWVERAREEGKKILFRCQCGCHRAGRLSAFYEMKYMQKSIPDVITNLYRFGKNMDHHTYLPSQIEALKDYIDGKPCRFEPPKSNKYCLRETGWVP